jgi:tetratricopeptide (TPR) repeat protein
MSKRLTESNISECQAKFNLSYHISYAHVCQQLVGFEGKDVLEVGGSLPTEFVIDYLNVKSWSAIETPDYETALKEVGGLTHKGTVIRDINDYSSLGFKNRELSQYNLFLENIENLPPAYYGKYDLIFLIAAFEHIQKFPQALERMFLALKPGGQLFSMFSPIWSAPDGHHLPNITDQEGNSFNFGNSPIPPWGHLLMRPTDLAQYLYQVTDKETAYLIVYYVYNSPHINRFFTEDYVDFINQSSFTVKKLDLTFPATIDQETQLTLEKLHPGRKNFQNNGILAILEKNLEKDSKVRKSVISVNSQKESAKEASSPKKFQLKTPICLIIFKRPDTTEKVFEAIRQAKPPKLLVIADGPRTNRPGEAEKCAAARAIINRVDWDCEVLTNYSDTNLGCRHRVSSGLDWVFDLVEEAIILEDDCLPHPTFFQFCEELLERYRHDEQVMVIAGNNFQFGRNRTEYSYYFSRYSHCWGWATWRRAWQHYDNEMKLWPQARYGNLLAEILQNSQAASYWSINFQGVYEGFNSWAYPWKFACWIHNGLTILPNINLVSNIGFDQEATHTTVINTFANMPTEAISFPLQHPPVVIRNTQADDFTEKIMFSGTWSKPVQMATVDLVIHQALAQLNANNNTEALSLLEKAIATNPDVLALNYGKAIALARLGHTDEAVDCLDNLLAVMPANRKAQLLRDEIKLLSVPELMKQATQALEANKNDFAFNLLLNAKSFKQPTLGLDYLRATCFLRLNQQPDALQSLYEELRYFPDHAEAKNLLNQILTQYPQIVSGKIEDAEFQELLAVIRPYTMLSEARLYSLFSLAKRICVENIPGNFVECGVAGGGSTALMAAVIKRYTTQPRLLYAFDSFEGMPVPTEQDKCDGIPANATGWGTGTCAAPEASVRELCSELGVSNIVKTVKGYFEDTLPKMRNLVGMIALLHMDSDWYESTKTILHNLYDQVVKDGFIQVDDYGHWDGCHQALHEFEALRQIKFDLKPVDYSGVWFSTPNKFPES